MRVAVLSDTHMRDTGSRVLPAAAWKVIRSCDAVLHAGDVVEPGLLAELGAVAPVHAVLGNNDHSLRGVLPETLSLDVDGVRIAVVHDSGPKAGREGRMRRRFPDADVVVFGHSHVPWNDVGIDGQLLLNPGSPTERRGQPHRTMAVLDVRRGVARAEIVVVD